MRIEDVQITVEELAEFKRRNFEDRMDWIDFKVQWMREHGKIQDA